jgi:phosphoenolpyruvate carboxylase
LIPIDWTPSDETQEVLDTFRVIAQQPASALGAYVISMASHASDVLAVHLLLKATGTRHALPVAPLFETLSDLESAPHVIDNLLTNTWFKFSGRRHLMVMIGYSDSAKDAGVLAASWAQYTAQEALLAVCEQHKISLQLFHGRGGTIGRGGAPARAALLSQPPGSLRAGLRVTEQGEMIRTKLGLSALAVNTLALYAGAICSANLQTPPAPKPQWRELMREMAASSCEHYRAVVQREPDFVRYFRYATPEQELAKLPLGSRPARRRSDGGISSLRAIPWIFAWMQNRLMLPAWLGAGAALSESIASGNAELIAEMRREWPFFNTRMSMLEMVFTKSDPALSAHSDATLVPSGLAAIGERLRTQLAADISTVLTITGNPKLMSDDAWARESVQLRNVYTDPLNYLQAELLRRTRESSDEALDQALMVTIAGIAAGMRNTG